MIFSSRDTDYIVSRIEKLESLKDNLSDLHDIRAIGILIHSYYIMLDTINLIMEVYDENLSN